jgi:hypothetical protein
MRPVTSELTSTLVRGWICPLAVTEATRSRASTASTRTAVALPRLLAAVTPKNSAAASTTPPAIDHFTRLLIASSLLGPRV